MRHRILVLVLSTTFTALSACPKPGPITQRYRSYSISDSCLSPPAVSVFALPVPPQNPPNVLKLGDRAQAALVEAVRSYTDNSSELFAELARPISQEVSKSTVDGTRFMRRIVISIENTSDNPADRLSQLKARLVVDTTHARFLTWDKIVSQFDTVDLGSLKATTQSSLGGIETTFGQTPSTSIKLPPVYERSLEEEAELKQRYVASTGILTDHTAEIVQQSVVGIDLTGNIVMDIEIDAEDLSSTTVTSIDNLRDVAGDGYVPQEKVRFRTYALKYPFIPDGDGLRARAELWYTIRQTQSNDKSIIEGDDDVLYCREVVDATPENPVLIRSDEMELKTWGLGALGTEAYEVLAVERLPTRRIVTEGDSLRLDRRATDDLTISINFRTEPEAWALREWLHNQSTQAGALKIASRTLKLCSTEWEYDYTSEEWVERLFSCRDLRLRDVAQLTVDATDWNHP